MRPVQSHSTIRRLPLLAALAAAVASTPTTEGDGDADPRSHAPGLQGKIEWAAAMPWKGEREEVRTTQTPVPGGFLPALPWQGQVAGKAQPWVPSLRGTDAKRRDVEPWRSKKDAQADTSFRFDADLQSAKLDEEQMAEILFAVGKTLGIHPASDKLVALSESHWDKRTIVHLSLVCMGDGARRRVAAAKQRIVQRDFGASVKALLLQAKAHGVHMQGALRFSRPLDDAPLRSAKRQSLSKVLASVVILAAICVVGCGIQVTRIRVNDIKRKRKLGKWKKYRSVAENDDDDERGAPYPTDDAQEPLPYEADMQGMEDIDTLDSMPDGDTTKGDKTHEIELR